MGTSPAYCSMINLAMQVLVLEGDYTRALEQLRRVGELKAQVPPHSNPFHDLWSTTMELARQHVSLHLCLYVWYKN